MNTAPVYLNPEGACPAQGLYSHSTRVSTGTMYYLAGQLSVAEDGGVAGKGDFAAQFIQVFANLEAVLKGLGLGWRDIVKFTTFMVHSQHIELFMRLRAEHFPHFFSGDLFPPNTLLVVNRLVKEDFLLEVEAIACKSAEDLR